MIQKDAINKIRRVIFYHNTAFISGFCFFDKDGALLWKIGYIHAEWIKETVLL
jgi:hypothetical protein